MRLRSPLSAARGLGAAHAGVQHWQLQRLTAIGNIVLVLWFLFSCMALAGSDYAEVRAWLASPISASLMILLVISVTTHVRLGLQVVIEDYIHHDGGKVILLAAVSLITAALGVAAVVSVLKVSIGS
jgi:succinate dehydrogenase / fumarate reductase membrane anchor subunit